MTTSAGRCIRRGRMIPISTGYFRRGTESSIISGWGVWPRPRRPSSRASTEIPCAKFSAHMAGKRVCSWKNIWRIIFWCAASIILCRMRFRRRHFRIRTARRISMRMDTIRSIVHSGRSAGTSTGPRSCCTAGGMSRRSRCFIRRRQSGRTRRQPWSRMLSAVR